MDGRKLQLMSGCAQTGAWMKVYYLRVELILYVWINGIKVNTLVIDRP